MKSTLGERVLSIDFPFMLGDMRGMPIRISSMENGYTLIVEGSDRFVYQLGERIQYTQAFARAVIDVDGYSN